MKGIIVAPEPLAAKAGKEIFVKGGNAFDAAVSAAFAQCVVNPLLCGIGGSSLAYVYDGKSKRRQVLDGSVTVGSKPLPENWIDLYGGRSEKIGRYILEGELNQMGHQSIMVPGFIRNAHIIFDRYGSGNISWEEIIEPAIRLAEGFEVYPYIENFWKNVDGAEDKPGYPGLCTKLKASPDAARIFAKNSGEPYKTGDVLVQSDLAKTLRKIAADGPDIFYEGELADKILDDFDQHNALISREDWQNYRVLETEPIKGTYRGYEITSALPPGSGPQMIQMLQIAEHFDLASMDPNSAEYIDLVSRIMRIGFQDNVCLKNDPPYSIGNELVQKFISRDYALQCAKRVEKNLVSGTKTATGLGCDTTHVTVADKEGNVISWTHTLGSVAGSGVVTPGTGILHNNFLGHFNPLAFNWESIIPGKRGGGGVPVIIFKDGNPVIALGAPGGSRIITAIFQSIINVIDHGISMQEAVSVPRFHSEEENLIFIEPNFPAKIMQDLLLRGYNVQHSTYMSRVQAVYIDPNSSKMMGGADPRGGQGLEIVD